MNWINLRQLRTRLRENQTAFWSRFGVTQSQGSRFEQGTAVPAPVALLLALYTDTRIDDADLAAARAKTGAEAQAPPPGDEAGEGSGGLQHPELDGLDDGLLPRLDVKLAHDVRHVEIDGGFGSAKDARHFP